MSSFTLPPLLQILDLKNSSVAKPDCTESSALLNPSDVLRLGSLMLLNNFLLTFQCVCFVYVCLCILYVLENLYIMYTKPFVLVLHCEFCVNLNY